MTNQITYLTSEDSNTYVMGFMVTMGRGGVILQEEAIVEESLKLVTISERVCC